MFVKLWVNPANQMNQANQASLKHGGFTSLLFSAGTMEANSFKLSRSNTKADKTKRDIFPETLTERAAEFCRTGPTPVSECDFEHWRERSG